MLTLCVLQFAAEKRIQINFCAIPEDAEEGVQQTLADFASSILDADNATLTCCSDGNDQSHHQWSCMQTCLFWLRVAISANCTFCGCYADIAGIEEACMSFLRNLIAPPGQSVRLVFSAAAGHMQFINCSASCDVLPADKPITASKCCPCHGLPITTAGENAQWRWLQSCGCQHAEMMRIDCDCKILADVFRFP